MILRLLIGAGAGACVGALTGYFGRCSSGTCPLTANPYQGAVYGAILGAVFAFILAGTLKTTSEHPGGSKSSDTNKTNGTPTVISPGKNRLVQVKNEAAFERYVLNADKPCVADFYSDRCGPCRLLAPTMNRLAAKYDGRAVVCKVSLDSVPGLAAPYKIRGIPAVLFFEAGKEVHRLIGLRRQKVYEHVIDSMLKN